MRHSEKRILTTHAGSLSRPNDLIELNRRRAAGEAIEPAAYAQLLAASVSDVVRKQRELGIDIPNDGEFGKPMAASYDYGVWWNYAFARMSGFVPADRVPETQHKRSSVADLALATISNRRDWIRFSEFYRDPESTGALLGSAARRPTRRPVCTGPIEYVGHAAVQADIANLKQAMAMAGVEEGFITSVSPGSFARGEDLHYKNEEEFVYASAEAMREEYKAIVDAGLVLQIDDPSLPDNWDLVNPEPPLREFKKFERVRIDALNHALRGLPAEHIRYHICWGSWHGPHTTDIPLADIVEPGKVLIPGVVSHATNIVEHPQVVADRIVRYARVIGRENVIAGTDCGLGGRVHPQIAWAKLAALAEGAKLASKELWPRRPARARGARSARPARAGARARRSKRPARA